MDHDAEVASGVASGLVTLLRRSMFLYENAKVDDDHSRGFRRSGVQYIASLSTSLTMVLYCSSKNLANCVKEFHTDLVPTLTMMAEKFGSNEAEDAILLHVILANASRTIHLISPYLQDHTEEFVDALLLMLRGETTTLAIKASVCDTLCNLVTSDGLVHRDKIISKLEDHACPLLSLLSTDFSNCSGDGIVNLTIRLYELAELSEVIRTKMMKLRCAMRSIVRHFHHPNLDIRLKAYSFCRDLANHPEIS